MSTFQELGLNDQVVQAITELGYENPTPIQAEAIPQVLTSKTDLNCTGANRNRENSCIWITNY